MSKAPKKFRGKAETVKLPRYFITGGVCKGYFINDRQDGNEQVTVPMYENMWDAINERNRLNAPSSS